MLYRICMAHIQFHWMQVLKYDCMRVCPGFKLIFFFVLFCSFFFAISKWKIDENDSLLLFWLLLFAHTIIFSTSACRFQFHLIVHVHFNTSQEHFPIFNMILCEICGVASSKCTIVELKMKEKRFTRLSPTIHIRIQCAKSGCINLMLHFNVCGREESKSEIGYVERQRQRSKKSGMLSLKYCRMDQF